MKTINIKNSVVLLALVAIVFTSCDKNELEPTIADDIPVAVTTVDEARQYLNGSYALMASSEYWGRNTIIVGEVRADNVFANFNSGRFVTAAQMNFSPTSGTPTDIMRYAYGTMANLNLIINAEEIEGDQAEINHAKGEAYALRALIHYDLVRLYGQQFVNGQGGLGAKGVSYATEFKGDPLYVERSTVADNKAMIYADLDTASSLLSSSLDDNSKYTITTNAAFAIKCRVATYFKDYSIASASCGAIINEYSLTPAASYADYWVAETAPAASIFELVQTSVENNGINGLANIYQDTNYGDIEVLEEFITDAEFSATDVRASSAFIAADPNGRIRNVGKYNTVGSFTDNIKVIRYAEVVLNYAEALLESNPTQSLQLLNSIPQNRDGSTYTVATYENIIKERRKELAFEGYRFDDLARSGRNIPVLNGVDQTHGGPSFGSTDYALPIPRQETDNNPLSSQNAGYGN